MGFEEPQHVKIETGSKLVMIGASITDAGRAHDLGGEGLFEAYGSGYAHHHRQGVARGGGV
jgi:hypothetical protein